MTIATRPVDPSDLGELLALQQAWDTRWFGAPEHDESELRESLDRVSPIESRSVQLHDGGRLVAAGWWWKDEDTSLIVDPAVTGSEVPEALVRWLVGSGAVHAEVLARDESLRSALDRAGWEHYLSQFELLREGDDLPTPSWPTGVTTSSLDDHADAVHALIYEQAGWADVPGHGDRDLAEWRGLFVEGEDPEQQVLAWRDGALVGAALGKTFSDATGWVAQVAVRPDERGRGLGRALILEAFSRRLAAGAERLGLGVSAANSDALRLYESIGLEIDREWMRYRPAGG